SLTAEQLESLCTVMAQRLSILHGLNAPEFFDKTLFRQFIQRLLDEQVLSPDEEGRLHYLPELEDIAENTARRVLSAEIRLSARQVARSAGYVPVLAAVSAPGRRCIRLPPGASGRNCHASRGGSPCGRNPGKRPADAGRNLPCPTASASRATRCAGCAGHPGAACSGCLWSHPAGRRRSTGAWPDAACAGHRRPACRRRRLPICVQSLPARASATGGASPGLHPPANAGGAARYRP